MNSVEYIAVFVYLILIGICVYLVYRWIQYGMILKYAKRSECDYDGDIVLYKKKKYYVNLYGNHVERIKDWKEWYR